MPTFVQSRYNDMVSVFRNILSDAFTAIENFYIAYELHNKMTNSV